MILHRHGWRRRSLFYLLYVAGIVVFVNSAAPGNWQHNALYGALFGLFCYATFELTNMALLRHWEWAVVVPDIVWGATVTAASPPRSADCWRSGCCRRSASAEGEPATLEAA